MRDQQQVFDDGIKRKVNEPFLKEVVHVKFTNFLPGSQGRNKDGKNELHFNSDSHLSSLKRYLNFKNRKNNIDYMRICNSMNN